MESQSFETVLLLCGSWEGFNSGRGGDPQPGAKRRCLSGEGRGEAQPPPRGAALAAVPPRPAGAPRSPNRLHVPAPRAALLRAVANTVTTRVS